MKQSHSQLLLSFFGFLCVAGCKPRPDTSAALAGQNQQQEPQEQQGNPENGKEPKFDQQVEQYCQAQLQEFKQDMAQQQKQFMNKHVQKFDINGKEVDDSQQFFKEGEHFTKGPVHERKNQSFMDLKHSLKLQKVTCVKEGQQGPDGEPCDKKAGEKSSFKANDNPALLVYNEEDVETSAAKLDAYRSFRLSPAKQPWSDDYWAIYSGVIGKRYALGFPKSTDWKRNYDETWAQPASGNSSMLNRLAPSEKYDLVRGDAALKTTREVWAEGKKYYDANGSVETWMGICHGWAPAAYMLPRPARAVTVKGITFYPSDIKALGSYVWAESNYTSRFMGGRCNDKNPPTDSVGHITNVDCLDNNAGAWHIAAINQLAISKRSFVMDVTYDYEVWNQPVLGYAFKYFNPATHQFTENLASATVAKGSFADPFRGWRSSRGTKIAGVAMEVWYMVETNPQQSPSDSPNNDGIRRVRYLYDLELDPNGKIIGGEWYQNEHPDFMWTPGPGATQRVVNTEMGRFVHDLFEKSAAGGGGGGGGGGGDDGSLTFNDFLKSKFYGLAGRNLWLNENMQCTGKRASNIHRCTWRFDNGKISVRWDDGKTYWYLAQSRNEICFAGEGGTPGACQAPMRRQ